MATSDCFLQLPEIRRGWLTSMVTFRLAKYVGIGVAKRLLLTGMKWTAADALAAGLVDFVVPQSDVESSLRLLLDEMSQVDPDVVAIARRLLNESYATSLEDAVGNFLAAQARCLSRLRMSSGDGGAG